MKQETAIKRIKKAIQQVCPNESENVKNYLFAIVYDTYVGLESDYRDSYTSTKNLEDAIAINLDDEFNELLAEAKFATK